MSDLPANTVAGLAKMNEGKLLPAEQLAVAKKALEMMSEGVRLKEIAKEVGLSQGRITQLVLEHFPVEWQKAKTAANLIRYDEAQEEFDCAAEHRDGLKLAYAREKARYAHLMLQSTRKDIFGQEKVGINVQGDGIKIELVSFGDTPASK